MKSPQYTELAAAVSEEILSGNLPPGTRLPTHRAFAEKHGVALATATRAYRELEGRGLIVGERGRGVFVRDLGLPLMLGVEQTPAEGLLDLVFNMPAAATDPEILRSGLKRLASAGDLEAMLRYQPHGGRPHERKVIGGYASQYLGPVPTERLLVTSGGQHGLAITALGLFKRGDTVATDPLTYPGFKSISSLQGINLVPIDSIHGYMDPDKLESKCQQQKVEALYLMPTVHNPLGTVMPVETRHRIAEIADKYELLIIEDSAYAFLETNAPPSFVELAPERTIHIGGFSKSLATGLRLGYLIAPEIHISKLSYAIRATTWNAPAIISNLVVGWIEDGTLASSEKNRRRDGAIQQKLCRDILVDVPVVSHCNASFAWIPLRCGLRAEPIITCLSQHGIAVSAGEPYAVTESAPQALRLAFGSTPLDELRPALEFIRSFL